MPEETEYPIVKKVELYSDADGSDKSYFIFIEKRGEGTEADAIYHVTTKWGPRNGLLRDTPLTKDGVLVTFAKAQEIFNERWARQANGKSKYRVPDWAKAGDLAPAGAPSAVSAKIPEVPFNFSGMKFETADPDEIEQYIADNSYWFEQKADGVRGLTRILAGETSIHAHTGLLLKSSYAAKAFESIHREVRRIREVFTGETVLDGEILEQYWLFDLPKAETALFSSGPRVPYRDRRERLEEFFDGWRPEGVKLLPVAKTAEHKRQMVEELRRRNCEGVMIKHVLGTYDPGKRVRHSLKLKFCYTLDGVVMETYTETKGGGNKENARIGVYREGELVEVARASLIGKQHAAKISEGDVVELKYRGAVKRSVQPTILRKRTDKAPAECLYGQLVFMSKEMVDFDFQ